MPCRTFPAQRRFRLVSYPLLVLLVLWLAAAAAAQPPAGAQGQSAAEQVEAMSRLDFLVGDWQGEGWMEHGGTRYPFRGGELVQEKLGGLALLVEGDFRARFPGSDEERQVHATLGVISYDPESDVYRFDTWLAQGTHGERELTPTDDGWSWRIEGPQSVVRYTMKLTPEGEWYEIGERSTDGESWHQFFEMTLRKE